MVRGWSVFPVLDAIPFSGTPHPISQTPGLPNSVYFTPAIRTHRKVRDPIHSPLVKLVRAELLSDDQWILGIVCSFYCSPFL